MNVSETVCYYTVIIISNFLVLLKKDFALSLQRGAGLICGKEISKSLSVRNSKNLKQSR